MSMQKFIIREFVQELNEYHYIVEAENLSEAMEIFEQRRFGEYDDCLHGVDNKGSKEYIDVERLECLK